MLWGDKMFEIIMLVFALFLSIIGLSELMHRLWMALIRPKGAENFLITCLSGDTSVEQVSAALEELRWQGKNCATLLIGIDIGLNEEQKITFEKLSNENHDFIFTDFAHIEEIIKKRS